LAALKNLENKNVRIVALKMVRKIINIFATSLKILRISRKIGFLKPTCSVAQLQVSNFSLIFLRTENGNKLNGSFLIYAAKIDLLTCN
jgi:hypothetical protein